RARSVEAVVTLLHEMPSGPPLRLAHEPLGIDPEPEPNGQVLVAAGERKLTGRDAVDRSTSDEPDIAIRPERVPDVGRDGNGGRPPLDVPLSALLARVPRVADPYRLEHAALLDGTSLQRGGRRERIGRVNRCGATGREVLRHS